MKDYSVLLSCGEATMAVIHDAFDKGYQQGYKYGKKIYSCDNKDMDAEYNRGLNDAWEVIQKITTDDTEGGYSYQMLLNLFGFGFTSIKQIAQKYAPQDVIRMIKEHEGKQKQDIELKVGDEVVIDDSIGIVTRAFPGAVTCYVMRKDGSSGEEDRNDCKTTGRHFDAIAEVLAEMRGKSE